MRISLERNRGMNQSFTFVSPLSSSVLTWTSTMKIPPKSNQTNTMEKEPINYGKIDYRSVSLRLLMYPESEKTRKKAVVIGNINQR